MAGNIEDLNSNAPLSVDNLARILDNMYWMSSIALLHAAQAVDLRDSPALGEASDALLEAYRTAVPFVEQDRIYTIDFANGYEFLRSGG